MTCQIRLQFGTREICTMPATFIANTDEAIFYVCETHKKLLPKMQPKKKFSFQKFKAQEAKVTNIRCLILRHREWG